MLNNKGIASELTRIAKGLVSSGGVANTEGEYKMFNGTIDWEGNKGEVRNADFKLISNYGIEWEGGIWVDGIWKKGYWEEGTWKDGTWKGGKWNYGTWEDGIWERGRWDAGKDRKGRIWFDSPDEW